MADPIAAAAAQRRATGYLLNGQRTVKIGLSRVAVRPGDDLEDVAAGVVEVHATPAVVGVDHARLAVAGVRPERQTALLDTAEDPVELVLIDEEGVVLGGPLAIVVVEVKRHLVAKLDSEERAPMHRCREPEQSREELSRGALVASVDDRVVQLDGHGRPGVRSIMLGMMTGRYASVVRFVTATNPQPAMSRIRRTIRAHVEEVTVRVLAGLLLALGQLMGAPQAAVASPSGWWVEGEYRVSHPAMNP